MEKRNEKNVPTTQPCEAPRTCLRAAHQVVKEPKPGGRAVGVLGVETKGVDARHAGVALRMGGLLLLSLGPSHLRPDALPAVRPVVPT